MRQEIAADDEGKRGGNGRWLSLIRMLWIILAAAYFLLLLVSLPGYYQRVSSLTIEPYRLGERVIFDNAEANQDAEEYGLSPQAYAAFDIAFTLFQIVVYYLLATLIAWRTTTGFGWFTAFVLLLLPVASLMGTIIGVARPFAHANLFTDVPGYLVWPAYIAWLYLFPNGRPVPRRMVWPMALLFTLFMVMQLVLLLAAIGTLPPRMDTLMATVSPFLILPVVGIILYAQIYRYRYDATLLERQQMKWFLFGLGIFFGFMAAFVLLPEPVLDSVIIQNILALISLIFPLSVALAILRYRLFDVDILIRRTLVYTVLSGLLAMVYFGMVILLQRLFVSVSGQQSPIAIVISTLVIYGLFAPLRRRIQDVIDRRFYRKKYNAQQVLAQFSQTARDETDMDALTAELVRVVQETMQPVQVSVWLKPTNDSRRTVDDNEKTYWSYQ